MEGGGEEWQRGQAKAKARGREGMVCQCHTHDAARTRARARARARVRTSERASESGESTRGRAEPYSRPSPVTLTVFFSFVRLVGSLVIREEWIEKLYRGSELRW